MFHDALISPSTRPRYAGGMNSSIAELIAPYSPPMPTPVMKRNTASDVKSHAKPVSTVAMP